jgi:acetyl-CoA carboxylase carboxyl transferase subunit alpha
MGEDFEQPLLALEKEIADLRAGGGGNGEQVATLERRLAQLRADVFSRLTPWQKALVARHPRRPYTLDYVGALVTDFVELHGDRRYADDPAIVCGFGVFRGRPAAIVGHQKGRTTKEKLHRNFGMPRPEGYRKALRIMQLADKFGRPVICFVDTPGAYPGIDAEERGQAEAIAFNLREMARLRVPVIVTVTGEGGSGGALAIGVGNRVNILQNAVYSVISPEGCASILFRDAGRAPECAASLRLTADELVRLDVIDEVVPEPPGGAHADPPEAIRATGEVIEAQLAVLERLTSDELVSDRYDRFRRIGKFTELAF